MAIHFRKRIRLFSGVYINIGKQGISSGSVGTKGFRITANKKGVYRTVGIPGTGIYDRSRIYAKTKRTKRNRCECSGSAPAPASKMLPIITVMFFLIGSVFSLFTKDLGAVCFILSGIFFVVWLCYLGIRWGDRVEIIEQKERENAIKKDIDKREDQLLNRHRYYRYNINNGR